MAKAKQTRSEGQEKVLTKKQITRSKKVARQQRIIWIGVTGVTLLILAVLIAGIVQEYVLAPRRPVAMVNNEQISRAEYQKRVRYRQWDLQLREQDLLLQQSLYDPNDETLQFWYEYLSSQISLVQQQQLSLPTQALDDLIDEALVRQEATRRGITVSSDEIQVSIEQQFGYDRQPPEPTPTPITTTTTLTPTTPVAPMTLEEFNENYNSYIEAVLAAVEGFSEEDFRQLVQQGLLNEKLNESLTAEVPTTDEHVHAYQILVADEATATEVLEKLKAGESFADLAAQYSTDEDTKEKGGEVGWLAKDQAGVLAPVLEAAFALQPDEFSAVVETTDGYYIVTIDERQADYPLDEATLAARQGQAFSNWLTSAQEAATIERNWSPEDVPTE